MPVTLHIYVEVTVLILAESDYLRHRPVSMLENYEFF